MDTIIKQVSELNSVEYRACWLANFGWDDGYMRQALSDIKHGTEPTLRTGTVIMLWEGPDNTVKSLRAWALLTPTTTRGWLRVSRYAKGRSKYVAQFWVKRQYRKQGLGKKLLDEVYKIDSLPFVFTHDDATGALVKNRPVTTMGYMRRNVPKPKAV